MTVKFLMVALLTTALSREAFALSQSPSPSLEASSHPELLKYFAKVQASQDESRLRKLPQEPFEVHQHEASEEAGKAPKLAPFFSPLEGESSKLLSPLGASAGADLTSPMGTWVDWAQSGRARARAIVAAAYSRATDANWQQIYTNVWNALGYSNINWPGEGTEYTSCYGNIIAFTYVGYGNIYLCRSSLEAAWFQEAELAQTLIHEAAHVVGYANECDATRIEVYSSRSSGYGMAYKNGYYDNCDI